MGMKVNAKLSKLRDAADDRLTAVGLKLAPHFAALEARALSLPRGFESESASSLRDKMVRTVLSSAFSVYAMKTGKSTDWRLMSRELKPAGKKLTGVNIGLNVVTAAALLHELWVRKYQQKQLEQRFVEMLDRERARTSSTSPRPMAYGMWN